MLAYVVQRVSHALSEETLYAGRAAGWAAVLRLWWQHRAGSHRHAELHTVIHGYINGHAYLHAEFHTVIHGYTY